MDDGSLSQGISQENQAQRNVTCIRETEDETRRDIETMDRTVMV
jgi:hypothetical protein